MSEPGRSREAGPGGLVGRGIDEFVHQLRGFTERARGLAGAVPSRLSLPALPSPPGAMSAAQLKAIAQAVSAQRRTIEAMSAQLQAFDQQLAVFERILEPLVDWSSTWARLEEAVGDLVRHRDSGPSPSPSPPQRGSGAGHAADRDSGPYPSPAPAPHRTSGPPPASGGEPSGKR